MKKYKHKQTGIIVEHYNASTISGSCNYYSTKDSLYFPPKLIENTNDWEEIKEKLYEIIAYRHKISKRVYTKKGNNFYTESSVIPHFESSFGSTYYEIYSVKRIRDGEVFTIGDKVEFKIGNRWDDSSVSSITGFIVIDDQVMIDTTISSKWAYLTDRVRVVKIPLFTTEDGVDIYEGDSFWVVEKDFYIKFWNAVTMEPAVGNKKYLESKKKFSTEDKAKEYVFLNKKSLSINDFDLILHPDKDYQYHRTTVEKAVELVKSRQ